MATKETQTKQTEKKGLTVTVYDLKGKEKDTVTVSKEIFGQKENKALIAQYIRVYNTNQRQGTVAAKTRSEVTGSTKKIYRQKGTGRARHGANKANLFVGGGVTFGPKPRDFSLDMNKKQKKQALFVSLSMKMHDKAVVGIDDKSISMAPKTKEVADFINALKLDGKKVLFVLPKMEKNGLVLSARNIEGVDLAQASTLNPYQVLMTHTLVFVGDALKSLEDHFIKKNEN